jgi:hypothetical protein
MTCEVIDGMSLSALNTAARLLGGYRSQRRGASNLTDKRGQES